MSHDVDLYACALNFIKGVTRFRLMKAQHAQHTSYAWNRAGAHPAFPCSWQRRAAELSLEARVATQEWLEADRIYQRMKNKPDFSNLDINAALAIGAKK
jgi:hypothetical protein